MNNYNLKVTSYKLKVFTFYNLKKIIYVFKLINWKNRQNSTSPQSRKKFYFFNLFGLYSKHIIEYYYPQNDGNKKDKSQILI